MTHLAHPALSLSGKRKGKLKFASAAAKQKHLSLEAEWIALQNKWGVDPEDKKKKRATKIEPLNYSLSPPPGRTTSNHIPSKDTGHFGPISSKPAPQYTGTKMLGIGTLHKSNAVPVFSEEEARAISKMRR